VASARLKRFVAKRRSRKKYVFRELRADIYPERECTADSICWMAERLPGC
jgi:hypothetical protein